MITPEPQQLSRVEARIAANIGFIIQRAQFYLERSRGVSLDDLIQQGRIAIVKADEKFDDTHGANFLTYAAYWINQHMQQWIIKTSKVVRIPNHRWGSANPCFTDEISLNAPIGHSDDDRDRSWEELLGTTEHVADRFNEDRFEILRAALAQLKPTQRDAIERYFFREQNLPAMARETGITVEGARQRLQEGLKALRRKPELRRAA